MNGQAGVGDAPSGPYRNAMRQIPQRDAPTADEFRTDILPAARPVVLRDAAAVWPLVRAASVDAEKCMAMLAVHSSLQAVEVLRADPSEEGRFHYAPDGHSMNFVRGRGPFPAFLAALREQALAERPCALVIQGVLAESVVPGFSKAHPMPLVPPDIDARLWIGNAAKVATHKDPFCNVGVVVAGRRRFTLFPPEAADDLHMGPTHPTPAGTPVSMVHVTAPDHQRYPRFIKALEVAEEAELGPGDAIFIPKNWFHHVEATERFNILANYWWDASADG